MTFQLPDLRPKNIPLPQGRQVMSYEQAQARLDAEAAWYRPLTNKQRRFVCALYANGFDQAAAAMEADPEIANEREARRIGNKWLMSKHVQAALRAVDAYYTATTKIRFEDLVNELSIIAFSNIADHVNADGEPRAVIDTNPKVAAIKKITRRETKYGEDTTIELHDKLGAIEKLLKIYAPKGSGVSAEDEERKGGDTNVAVTNTTFNIMPVPRGEFLPPPPEPEFQRSPLIDAVPITQLPVPPVPVRP